MKSSVLSTRLEAALPAAGGAPFVLRNVRVPAAVMPGVSVKVRRGDLVEVDLGIEQGKITRIEAAGTGDQDGAGLDLGRAMVWPCPVNAHTHLDKGLVWSRSPNPDGSFAAASKAATLDVERYQTASDVRARAGFALRSAFAYGTRALRTHVDAHQIRFDERFGAMCELAAEWQDQMTLQVCPFTSVQDDPAWVERLAHAAADQHSGVLSIFLEAAPDLDEKLDAIVRLAEQHGLGLDFHADENLDPASQCTRAVAEAILRTGFEGPVLIGHCCALSVQAPEVLQHTLEACARARVSVVSLPGCNAYLMDRRFAETPRLRGAAPVREIRAQGIEVSLASDNIRDPFHAYGDLDMVDLFRDAVRMLHLDHPIDDWAAAVTNVPARQMGLTNAGEVRVGAPADLIVFRARNWNEFIARSQHDRVVLRKGLVADASLPDYRELDALEGMAP